MCKTLPVYVVNLDRCPERRSRISTRLRHLGLDFKVISAIDYTSAKDQAVFEPFYERILANPSTRWMVEGQAACTLSHYKVYDLIAQSGVAGGIVLEDDAIPRKSFLEAIELCQRSPQAGVILFSYYCHDGRPVRLSRNPLLQGGYSSVYSITDLFKLASGMGYYISAAAARRLSDLRTPRPLDDWASAAASLNDCGLGQLSAVYPHVMYAEAEESTINYISRSVSLKSVIASGLRSFYLTRMLLREFASARARRRRECILFEA